MMYEDAVKTLNVIVFDVIGKLWSGILRLCGLLNQNFAELEVMF